MKESFHYMLMVTQAVFHKKLLTGLQGTGLTLGCLLYTSDAADE